MEKIRLGEILVEESMFSLKNVLFTSSLIEDLLTESFQRLGILSPVLSYRDKKNRFHLIDGAKRVAYAKENDYDLIDSLILPETTPVSDILTLILQEKGNEISESAINKIQFLSFSAALDVAESWLFQSLCKPLGLKPHRTFLEECRRISCLPPELKRFCHVKRFSLKQILNLTHYTPDILSQLASWQSHLPFTASIMDEIASNLRDYLRAEGKTIHDFISETEVEQILRSSMQPKNKMERLRELIASRRFPILTEVNERIEKKVRGLNLPGEMTVIWDRTLENMRVDIAIRLQGMDSWAETVKRRQTEGMENTLRQILDEL